MRGALQHSQQLQQHGVMCACVRDVVVDCADERRSLLLELGLLLVDHQRQQLLLQAVLRHNVCNQRALSGNLRAVVRVAQLHKGQAKKNQSA
jgi:hypothetical protein